MKKLLGIIVFGLILNGNAFANIFNCVIDDYDISGNKVDITIVIDVDNFNKSSLVTTRSMTSNRTADDFTFTLDGRNGKLIITSSSFFMIKKGSYDLFVSSNSKKDDNNYFKGIFTERSFTDLIHTVIIEVWSPKMPIYLFIADSPRKVFKGTCKWKNF